MNIRPDTIHKIKETRLDWRDQKWQPVFEDMSLWLPLEASLAGMTLEYELPDRRADPIYLRDQYGHTLKMWETPPSLGEVREVALSFVSKE